MTVLNAGKMRGRIFIIPQYTMSGYRKTLQLVCPYCRQDIKLNKIYLEKGPMPFCFESTGHEK